jgi:methyl-accepting chemotaxis protein
MDLDQAIQKHTEWRMKFRTAMSNKETMDALTIGKDNCCELGKWLYGDGKKECGSLSAFEPCVAAHRNFHVEAGKVAAAINAKKFEEADKMIGSGSGYLKASTVTGGAILKLKQELGKKAA